jgi:hypothetical protein
MIHYKLQIKQLHNRNTFKDGLLSIGYSLTKEEDTEFNTEQARKDVIEIVMPILYNSIVTKTIIRH